MSAIAIILAAAQPLAAKDVGSVPGRMIEIDGGRNFRDVGGYRTADGHWIRWATLYRSGSLGSLTPSGMVQLQHLNVRAIIDLRMTEERRRDPNNWLATANLGYWTRDYRLAGDGASLAQVFKDPAKLTSDSVRAAMIHGYRTMPKELAPQYRELFARLLARGESAVVVSCTAGKDRTGIAAALVLTALGVLYKTVREDFLLSNTGLGMTSLAGSISPQIAALPPEIAKPLLGVEGPYLDAAFDQLRKDYGSVEAYLEKELAIGPAQVAMLKRRMLF